MSINDKCPCGSGLKYKKCCKTYHDGRVPKTALLLMKSRYSAYALNQYKYILSTAHETKDTIESVKDFSQNTIFEKLYILENIEGDTESFITFRATLFSNDRDISFTEKSKFVKRNDKWFYVDGEIS